MKRKKQERKAWDHTEGRYVICTHPTYCIPSYPVGERIEVYSDPIKPSSPFGGSNELHRRERKST